MMNSGSEGCRCGLRASERFCSNVDEAEAKMPSSGGDLATIWGEALEDIVARRPKAEWVERKDLKEEWSSGETTGH
jgi:hypothetical protein